jgi:hypothetical protein
VYIETGAQTALAYLTDLANLEHWTLGTRVHEQVDLHTWVGSVTSSRDPVYFHLQQMAGFAVPTFEWQVGRAYGRYAAVHRLFVIPASFAHPDSKAGGVYVHWLSFSNPKSRTILAAQGYDRIVHETESRNLKAVLECAQGLRAPARASHSLCASSLYVNAPPKALGDYVGNLGHVPQWARMWRPLETISAREALFADAYQRPFLATSTVSADASMALVDLHFVPESARPSSRILNAILPCAHVFGDASAPGCVLHRIAFAADGDVGGPHDARDLFAESLNIKRHVELLAGRPDSFAQGFSYQFPA